MGFFSLKSMIHYVILNDKATIELSTLDSRCFWWNRSCKSDVNVSLEIRVARCKQYLMNTSCNSA